MHQIETIVNATPQMKLVEYLWNAPSMTTHAPSTTQQTFLRCPTRNETHWLEWNLTCRHSRCVRPWTSFNRRKNISHTCCSTQLPTNQTWQTPPVRTCLSTGFGGGWICSWGRGSMSWFDRTFKLQVEPCQADTTHRNVESASNGPARACVNQNLEHSTHQQQHNKMNHWPWRANDWRSWRHFGRAFFPCSSFFSNLWLNWLNMLDF